MHGDALAKRAIANIANVRADPTLQQTRVQPVAIWNVSFHSLVLRDGTRASKSSIGMTQRARSTLLVVLLAGALVPCPLADAGAQTPLGSITGSVRDAETGSALASALVIAGQQRVHADSLGRFSLTGIPYGETRIRILRIGYVGFDTTVVVTPSSQIQLDVRLGFMALQLEGIPQRDIRAGEEKNVAAGRTDSSALGLLRRTPRDSPLTFSVFNSRFLNAMARARGADSNTVLSPISVAFALSIPLLGAGGETAKEIATTLGVNKLDRTTLRRSTAAAMSAGNGRQDVQLEISNALWVDTLVRLAPAFVDAVAPFHASVRTVPLRAPSAVGVINAWADSVTHGKISKVLDDRLPDTTRLFIANAVYFKGKWLDEFDKSQTRQRDFHLASGKTIHVDGMERTGHVGYRRGDGYQMIRLPYRGGRFAMYVVLPDSGTQVGAVEKEFAEHGLPPSLVQRDFREVHLVLPRLHVTASYDLKPALEAVGIHRAFDCDAADFGGIALEHGRQNAVPLCIGQARQTIYLDVDEEGTEAAAVTGLGVVVTTSAGPPPIQFIVDRPFFFLLRDEQTGADLFAGAIRHP
jgi:serpin B